MTARVAGLLREHGLPCGNEPVASYRYAPPSYLREADTGADADADTPAGATAAAGALGGAGRVGLEWEGALGGGWSAWDLPRIERFCGVFRTAGDRRLGDHLLAGLKKKKKKEEKLGEKNKKNH